MQPRADITVIGAGAAGLMAAIFAARSNPALRVVALDGAARIGAKILIAGGGRCNVTHDVVTPADFNGNRNAIAKVLRSFDVPDTIRFFADLGVQLKREETGKLFPTTDRARTVLDALLRAASEAGVTILSGYRVEEVAEGFRLKTSKGEFESRIVVIATGGRSVPKTGSDGHGYSIVRALGHSVTKVFPGLVPLVLEQGHWAMSLSGTSVESELAVRADGGRIIHRERGSLLFTHFGISGPVALDISRHWIAAGSATLTANFLPGATFDALEDEIVSHQNPRATIGSVLRGRAPERLLDVLAPATPLAKLTREERRDAVRAIVESPLPVVRDRGFDYAEVTAGGVPLSEIDLATMASRVRQGLYLCGEILDVDGKIGGYNFQWAWASGRLAGLGAARAIY